MPSDDDRRMLRDLLRLAARTRVPPLAVGANARFLVLDERHNLPRQRATQDWDFAARFQSWQGYHAFAATLQADGVFLREAPHRFVTRGPTSPSTWFPSGSLPMPRRRSRGRRRAGA